MSDCWNLLPKAKARSFSKGEFRPRPMVILSQEGNWRLTGGLGCSADHEHPGGEGGDE